MKHISIRQLFLFLLFTVFFFYSPSLIKGQTTNEEAAKKYGVTYPIASLGNCADYTSCRNYCEDETHRDTCIQYAKQKGFYEERKTDEILIHAKTELGCNSETECKNICEKEENFEKCTNFAKKTGLVKEQILSPKNQEILTKAKEILGCDSPQTCKSICEQEGNRQKCSEFAKQTGLKGGEEKRGPGGCNSEESCKTFCSSPDNFNECSKFKPPEGQERRDGPSQEGFRGPGGCTSESSCREYCEKNSSECQKFGPGPEGKEGERDKPPEGVKREEMEKLCKENPEKCKEQFGGGQPQNMKPENIQPQDMEKFCKGNPEKCRGQGPPQGSSEFKRPDEEFRPPENFQEPSEKRRESPPNQGPPPEQNQGPPPQNFSSGPPPEVKGVATIRNIVDKFLYFLLKK
ncbi:MAG: hypothetical protein UR56_C0007G0043 [Candidatus Roizmanbacteria bacterium GW2011_GWC2_34_23]|uniref:Uncharacterized protein n=1 Tax=Candidatus Roizmanbacteria bacterium GW2011_GWC2_34_23 TaxID=1618484 RepID=A0A0G0DFW0_9BACT|nr:MAG: hypothetical protein UR56_C0007G0043 [Candidatus Roizmanbacteria bacterium GW2011_GWC2_34_23]